MKTINVVAAVIRDGDRIYATQRGYGEFKGGWEFPGGKIEAGESAQEALVREIHEELDASICVGELIDTVEYDYPTFHLSMQVFWARLNDSHLCLKEHMAASWVNAEQMNALAWLPADLGLVEKIKASL